MTEHLCTSCDELLGKVVQKTSLTEDDVASLREPERTIELDVTFERDSGESETVRGYRVQWNRALGPTKGGLRFHPSVDLSEAAELAFLMTLKTSLAGLPYGGAKGGLAIDPKELTKSELERVSRSFARVLAPHIGEDRDIPAPDVNTNGEIMLSMLDEYEKIIGKKSPATFTGKPVNQGGSEGREEATGRGGFYILEKHFEGKNPADISVVIQGFGNVALHFAELASGAGFRIVAVSDSSGAIYDENGLDIEKVKEFKKTKRFSEWSGTKLSNEELIEVDTDVLVPAALGGVITRENAERIKAKTIIELANAATEPDADEILEEKGIEVIPDILANAGGVIVSYFEWLQNKQDEHWSLEKVNKKLQEMILEAYSKVMAETNASSISLRLAAYKLAIERVIQ